MGFTPREAQQARRLGWVVVLVAAFFVAEFAGALFADSVVLQADALHLLTDVLALATSLGAMRVAVRKATPRFTFGLRRAEPLAAVFSASLVLVTAGLIVAEGVQALSASAPPKPNVMLVVAVLALFVNGASAWMLHDVMGHGPEGQAHDPSEHEGHVHESHGHAGGESHVHEGSVHARAVHEGSVHEGRPHSHAHGHALNLRGAWLHLAGDTLGALAALVAAIVIRCGGPSAADPIASFFVAAVLLYAAVRLLRDAGWVLLEAAPAHLAPAAIRRIVEAFPEVSSIGELHLWTLGAGHDALTVHVCARAPDLSLGSRLSHRLRAGLGIAYVTVQVEYPQIEELPRASLAEPT